MDIKAAKTIFIAVLAFLVCYISPVCVVASWTRVKPESNGRTLLGHFAYLAMLMSSGINPVIYCFRVRRFRRALKQLLSDPCGKTPFQDSDQKLRFKPPVAQKPTSSYDYTRKEQFVCIYSDPKDQPSKGKTRPVNDMYVNNETAQEFIGEEDMGLRKVKPTNQTISYLQPSADCRDLVIEELNVDPKERPSDEKMTKSPTVNADYTV